MKIHLDKEKSLKHRQVLAEDSTDETRKDIVLQTDASSLLQIIEQLEAAKTAISGRKVASSS
jgi:hypothetical protein